MNNTTNNIIKNTIATTGNYGASGLMQPYQAEEFIKMIIDKSDFLSKITWQMRKQNEGRVSKLGVSARNLRKKIEDTSNVKGEEIQPIIEQVPYRTVNMRMDAEITQEWYDENIEQEGFETSFLGEIAEQLQLDLLDLFINGDESVTGTDSDSKFISINDGIIKLLENQLPTNQRIDASAINGGSFSDEYFYRLIKAIPNKYFNKPQFKWICSSMTELNFIEYLKNRQTTAGDNALLGGANFSPLAIGFEVLPQFPDDIIILANPKNFHMVYNYDIRYRMTTEGRELVSKNNRYYAWFLNNDTIIMEPNACAMLYNVGDILDSMPIITKPATTKKII